ncbi:MAG: YidC/Oxa1 family membrane protein insertase [Oscillospiraceae bacterium]|nr:YidC/Oxa1 family membrane protein insertase [Oscillospiraceae bacterium]
MILAFNIADIVQVPFGWLLKFLYDFTSSYGLALIIFAVLVKLVLMPATAKAKKSSMKMSRISPQVKLLQEKYKDDPQRQSAELQALYKKEGVSLGGSCLWSLLPLLILIPLYSVIRYPIQYLLGETKEVANSIIEAMKTIAPDLLAGAKGNEQLIVTGNLSQYADALKAALPELSAETLAGINFSFLGVDLGSVPTFNIFGAAWKWDWAHIGAFLIPVLSAGSQVLSMFVSQKMNNSVVTDENGVYDKETAQNSQSAQQGKMMMWMMPLMSLWIGFSIPAALSLYWFAQGIASLVSDVYLTYRYRKIYDAEDAVKIQRMKENEALEAEKERIRAERRAANPEGITANTSKKKVQAAKQAEKEAQKAAAAAEYAAKKGIVEEKAAQKPAATEDRPYRRGRAYDPERYKEN